MITTGQQLAITMGNLLEQMQGEDCPIVPLLEQYCEVLYHIYESAQDTEIPALQQNLKSKKKYGDTITVTVTKKKSDYSLAKVGESVKYVEAWDDFDLEVKKGSSMRCNRCTGTILL